MLSAGRVDFESYQATLEEPKSNSLGFKNLSNRILAISRLVPSKKPAIEALLREIELAALHQTIECVIVGEGPSQIELEQMGDLVMHNTDNRATVRFVGAFRVTASNLRQADLVVGQGRTVLEAIASGVPAAVCGNGGYFGLLTSESLPILATTNLTGRELQSSVNLADDLQRLAYHRREEFRQTYDLTFKMYDASLGAEAIGSALRSVSDYYVSSNLSRWQLACIWVRTCIKGVVSWIIRRLKFLPQH
jgi:hypothetical protein